MTSTALVAQSRTGLESLTPAQRDAAVTAYLMDARDRLHLALEACGPEAVMSIKAEASVVAEMARQVGVSKEIQADAQEMIRRAEFALGKAIRAGQERGEIAGVGDSTASGVAYTRTRNGRVEHIQPTLPDRSARLISPSDYLGDSGQAAYEIYAMSDGIAPETFEAALSEARAEGNVSRANVVRKVRERTPAEHKADKWNRVAELAEKGWVSEQIARDIGMSIDGLKAGAKREGIEFPADKFVAKRRRINTSEVLRRTVSGLEGTCMALQLIDLADIEDEGEAQQWVDSLTTSIRTLSKVNRQIRESIS